MFGWFKKKVKEQVEKDLKKLNRTVVIKTLKYQKETHNVGRTLVHYTLLDGRKFNVWVYGENNQYTNRHRYPDSFYPKGENATCSEFKLTSSLAIAQTMLYQCSMSVTTNFVDDPRNPSKSVSGQIVAAKIGKTEDYMEEIQVGYLVDEEVEVYNGKS